MVRSLAFVKFDMDTRKVLNRQSSVEAGSSKEFSLLDIICRNDTP